MEGQDQVAGVESTESIDAPETNDQESQSESTEEHAVEDGMESQEVHGSQEQATDWEKQYRSVLPEYTRSRQEIAELKAEVEQYRKQLSDVQTTPSDDPVDQALEQIMPKLREKGVMTKEEVEARISQEKADQQLRQEINRLETQFSGKDGRPKFEAAKIIDWALNQSGGSTLATSDLENAYKIMHFEELQDWHLKQATKKKAGTFTEKSDRSGAEQSQPSTDELLKKARKTGDFSAVYKKMIRVPQS